MSTAMRLYWLVTLVFFAGGCSSYKLAPYPGIEDEAEMAVELEYKVEVGDKVKITMTDGNQFKGKVMEISSDAITLEPQRRSIYEKNKYGEGQPRVIKADRIQTLEMRVGSGGKTTLLVFGIVAGTIALIAIGFAASGGMGSFGFESSK
jgi:hypothetical protein